MFLQQAIVSTRNIAARMTRCVPRVRGIGKLSIILNEIFLKMKCAPLALAPMKLGHKMIVDTRTLTEARSLYTGEYDDAKVRLLTHLMNEGSVFADVGANIGFYTVPLARAAREKGGRVVSFEPLTSNFHRLNQNVRLNCLEETVTAVPLGLSSEAGTATITLREDFLRGGETGNAAMLIDDGADEKYPATQVYLDTLDNFCSAKEEMIDLIKIDVEGHEDKVLIGGRKTIRRSRPIIMMEIGGEYFRRRKVDLYHEVRLVLPAGYRAYLPMPVRGFMGGDRFSSLLEIESFETRRTDNAFLIPDEKLDTVRKFTKIIYSE